MPTILNKYYPVRKILFFLGEGALIFASYLLINSLFTGWRIFLLEQFDHALRAAVVTLTFQTCLYFFDLYDLRKPDSTTDTFIRIMQAFGIGCIALGLIYYIVPSFIIVGKRFWCSYLIVCSALVLWRTLYYFVLEKKWFSEEIAVLGTGETAANIYNEIISDQECGFTLKAFIGAEPTLFTPQNIPVLPEISDLAISGMDQQLDRIIVALDDRRGTMPIHELLEEKLQGKIIIDGITFYESLTGKILVEKVNPAWLIFAEGFDCGKVTYLVKRWLDISLSLIGLSASLPISLVTAILIKIESPGPIFYTQERICERGKSFHVIKFRSMRNDAEKNGAVWASRNDARVTRVGRIIRKTRIDEIPQMINVLRGEMSFVGPRPERPVFVEQLTKSIPYYSLRHSVKPGVTGWAQVCYPYGASEEDALRKLEFDLYYIKNQSIFMDLLIIFRTVKTVLFQKGSR